MQKIGSSTTTANGAGEYTEGTPGSGINATLITAAWLNTVQRELVNLIQGASLTLNPADDSQVLKAVQALQTAMSTWAKITGKPTTVAGYGITDAFTKTETSSAIQAAVAALVASSPAALDTLKELATALGNDPNFATTMTNALAGKVAKADLKNASETEAGLISISSQPLTDAGIDDSTAVSPKKLNTYVAGVINLVGIQGAFKGLIVSASGLDAFASVSADELVLEDSNASYRVRRNVSVSPRLDASGANGLDTGVSVAATWYSVWVICTPSGVTAGLLSLSDSAPVMPAGYTFKARVGWVRTDASRLPLRFSQYGRSARYDVGNNLPAYPTVASGVASTAITVALTAVVPPTARRASLVAGTSNGGYVGFSPVGSFVATPGTAYLSPSQPNGFPFAGGYNSGSPVPTASGDIHLRSISVMYCATGASSILQCMGWEDNL